MNTEFSPPNPEDAEARVTALLLGELTPSEAAELERELAQNPELARLRDRLEHTIGLVKEAVAAPADEAAGAAGSTGAPARLSDARREDLLRRFKIKPVAAAAFQAQAQRSRGLPWFVPMGIAAGLMALLALSELDRWAAPKAKVQRSKPAALSLSSRNDFTDELLLRKPASEPRMPADPASQALGLSAAPGSTRFRADSSTDNAGWQDAGVPRSEPVTPEAARLQVGTKFDSQETVTTVTPPPPSPVPAEFSGKLESAPARPVSPPAAMEPRLAARYGFMPNELAARPEVRLQGGSQPELLSQGVEPSRQDSSRLNHFYAESEILSDAKAKTSATPDASKPNSNWNIDNGRASAIDGFATVPPLAGAIGGISEGFGGGAAGIDEAAPRTPLTVTANFSQPAKESAGATASETQPLALFKSLGATPETQERQRVLAEELRVDQVESNAEVLAKPLPAIDSLFGAERQTAPGQKPDETKAGSDPLAVTATSANGTLALSLDDLSEATVRRDRLESRGNQPVDARSAGVNGPVSKLEQETKGEAALLERLGNQLQVESDLARQPLNEQRATLALATPAKPQQAERELTLSREKDAQERFDFAAPTMPESAPGTQDVSRSLAAKKRELDKLVRVRETMSQRMLSENVDQQLPRSSIVEITDRAEAESAKNPTLWGQIKETLTGNTERIARIEVGKDTTDIAPILAGGQTFSSFDPYFLQTEFEKIKSKAVLNKVIEKLNLNETWARKLGLGEKLANNDVYYLLVSRIDVRPFRDSTLIEIHVKSDEPEEAARIANTIAETYRDLRHERVAKAGQDITKVLNQQLAEQDQQIARTQKELNDLESEFKRNTDASPIKPAAPAPVPQPEIAAADNAFSTFSMNVADVSFKLAQASLANGQMPAPDSIRGEEFINAQNYRDPEPPAGAPIGFHWERAQYPFAHDREVLRFAVRTAARGREAGKPLNLVLLLDNSGSMERADRVRIVREALATLAGQLQPQDRWSMITFARTAQLRADAVPGDQAGALAERVSGLTPEGGTNLEDALKLGYETAARHFQSGGVNRVVLLTDGAANLGEVDPASLKRHVESWRRRGVALDAFGIGWDGLNDDLLEELSRNGDGRYGFVNSPEEAGAEFANQLAGALRVAASDVKVQVEFNPQRVVLWRQIGYAKHQLTKEQFRDNTVDAAELAAAESGNALYIAQVKADGAGPIATVRARHRDPESGQYREQEWAVPYTGAAQPLDRAPATLRLAVAASAFSESLANSPFAGEVAPDRLLSLLNGVPAALAPDPRPQQLEAMIQQARMISGK